MTLHQLGWKVFDVDPKSQIEGFVQEIEEQTAQAETESINPATSPDSALIKRRGGRLNTKLRQQTTVQEFATTDQTHIGTFWERNFSGEAEVPWYKFQKGFLEDYESKLAGD